MNFYCDSTFFSLKNDLTTEIKECPKIISLITEDGDETSFFSCLILYKSCKTLDPKPVQNEDHSDLYPLFGFFCFLLIVKKNKSWILFDSESRFSPPTQRNLLQFE